MHPFPFHSTQSSKVLDCLGNCVSKQSHYDATTLTIINLHIKKDFVSNSLSWTNKAHENVRVSVSVSVSVSDEQKGHTNGESMTPVIRNALAFIAKHSHCSSIGIDDEGKKEKQSRKDLHCVDK